MLPLSIISITITIVSVVIFFILQLTRGATSYVWAPVLAIFFALGGPIFGIVFGFQAWRAKRDALSKNAVLLLVLVFVFFAIVVLRVVFTPVGLA